MTITASVGATALWLLPRLGDFQQRYPNIDIRLAANNKVFDLATEGADLGDPVLRGEDRAAGFSPVVRRGYRAGRPSIAGGEAADFSGERSRNRFYWNSMTRAAPGCNGPIG